MRRIIELLKSTNRPGVNNLINYLNASNFATASCYSHHKYRGGLVDHSLEVYEGIKSLNLDIPEESIIIIALLHDLGKSRLRGWHFDGHHPARAIAILERCGFELTEDEAFAIRYHHRKSGDAFTHTHRRAVTKADMASAAAWKRSRGQFCSKDLLCEMVAKFL